MKTPKLIFFCIFLLALMGLYVTTCAPQTASAQEANTSASVSIPVPTVSNAERDPGAVMTPLTKGQKAPFTGTLLSPKSIAILIAEFHAMPKRCDARVEAEIGRCKADSELETGLCRTNCEANTAILNSRLKTLEAVDDQNKKRIAELQKAQTNPLMWLLGGVVGGVLVTGTIVYISHQ